MKTILNYLILLGIIIIPEYGQAQLLSVSGYVKNFVSDKVIESATVYEIDSGIGTITNNEGYYKLLLKPGKQHLTISYPGFGNYSQEFELRKDTIFTVSLKPENFKNQELADGNKILADQEKIEKKSEPKK